MMAQINLKDATAIIERKGFITLSEPASGGGGMILAAAQVIAEQKYDPGQVMFFVATDVAPMCYHMTYLQTSILGLSGIVQHANSLSQQCWAYRFTPVCRVFPWRTNLFLADINGEVVELDEAEPVEAKQPITIPLQAALDIVIDSVEARTVKSIKAAKVEKPLSQEESLLKQGSLF